MKGKSYSIPVGMVFKKYHCCKCGAKLKKERTHRIVTKDDKDYYQYQDYGTFPRREYDVYDYRFKCPSCNSRISFDEQCIIKKIQKKCKSKTLSVNQIKDNYKECKYENNKRVLVKNILIPFIFVSLFFPFFYFFGSNREDFSLGVLVAIYVFVVFEIVIGSIRRYKGNYKLRRFQSYSHEEESKLNRLHTYCSHNKELVMTSKKCYCFYCKEKFNSSQVVEYIDDGQTALCPKCGVDTVLPDSIEEVNDELIDEMNRYWF